jgi:hypothetical protein
LPAVEPLIRDGGVSTLAATWDRVELRAPTPQAAELTTPSCLRVHHSTSIVLDRPAADRKGIRMRIFMFKSEAKSELRAFAGDSAGSKLPRQHGPWHATGVIRPDKDPPYNLPRVAIEKAIKADGFQLWRLKSKPSPPA